MKTATRRYLTAFGFILLASITGAGGDAEGQALNLKPPATAQIPRIEPMRPQGDGNVNVPPGMLPSDSGEPTVQQQVPTLQGFKAKAEAAQKQRAVGYILPEDVKSLCTEKNERNRQVAGLRLKTAIKIQLHKSSIPSQDRDEVAAAVLLRFLKKCEKIADMPAEQLFTDIVLDGMKGAVGKYRRDAAKETKIEDFENECDLAFFLDPRDVTLLSFLLESDLTQGYLDGMTERQKSVTAMLLGGMTREEIKKQLNITDANLRQITSGAAKRVRDMKCGKGE